MYAAAYGLQLLEQAPTALPRFTRTSGQSTFFTGISFPHETSGDARYLLVQVQVGATLTAGQMLTATYNGVTMTLLSNPAVQTSFRLFGLVNPATGSNTVTVNDGTLANCRTDAFSFADVDQAAPFSGFVASTTLTATPSVTVTSATGALVVGGFGSESDPPAPTATPGDAQTLEANATNGFGQRNVLSTEAGAASVTHSYTLSRAPEYGLTTWGGSLKASALPRILAAGAEPLGGTADQTVTITIPGGTVALYVCPSTGNVNDANGYTVEIAGSAAEELSARATDPVATAVVQLFRRLSPAAGAVSVRVQQTGGMDAVDNTLLWLAVANVDPIAPNATPTAQTINEAASGELVVTTPTDSRAVMFVRVNGANDSVASASTGSTLRSVRTQQAISTRARTGATTSVGIVTTALPGAVYAAAITLALLPVAPVAPPLVGTLGQFDRTMRLAGWF